jgi:hypothetical protein
MYKLDAHFFKRPTNALGFINVILLHNDYLHVLASQGGEYKNTNIIIMCQITPQFKNPIDLIKING